MAEVTELPRRTPDKAPLFECGQTVYLRSGSPPMTVAGVFASDKKAPARVTVDWFDDSGWNKAEFYADQICTTEPAK